MRTPDDDSEFERCEQEVERLRQRNAEMLTYCKSRLKRIRAGALGSLGDLQVEEALLTKIIDKSEAHEA